MLKYCYGLNFNKNKRLLRKDKKNNIYHNTRAYRPSAGLEGRISRSVLKAPGYTSCDNTESLQFTDFKAWYRFE